MLRFPYRRGWAVPNSGSVSRPVGFWSRLIRLWSGQRASGASALVAVKPSDNAPRPFVSIRIQGPVGSRRLRSALLDTGSQDTLFPAALAEPLGILLGGERHAIKWRGERYWVEFQTVDLELAQNEVVWRWQTQVGFTPAPLAYALLGQRSCLDFLDATFCGADQVVELATNRLFPGSATPVLG